MAGQGHLLIERPANAFRRAASFLSSILLSQLSKNIIESKKSRYL